MQTELGFLPNAYQNVPTTTTTTTTTTTKYYHFTVSQYQKKHSPTYTCP